MTTEPDIAGPGGRSAGAGGQDRSDADTAKPKRSDPAADVLAARTELAATLDAIQDRLNVPKRIRIAAEENPVALLAAAAGVAAAVAGGVWLLVRNLRSK